MGKAEKYVDLYRDYLVPNDEDARAAERAAVSIVDRYNEPWRHYHTIDHLAHMATFLTTHIEKLKSPSTVFLATIGHDSVYIPQLTMKAQNEELSAQLLAQKMRGYWDPTEIYKVEQYIRATANHDASTFEAGTDLAHDLAYFLDADMLIIGSDDETFDTYDANIRKEYSFVPYPDYKNARGSILKDFNKKSIFLTPEAREQYEDQAHKNLDRIVKTTYRT